nr:hypothetical protein CFP56_76275 [Quercus suber]
MLVRWDDCFEARFVRLEVKGRGTKGTSLRLNHSRPAASLPVEAERLTRGERQLCNSTDLRMKCQTLDEDKFPMIMGLQMYTVIVPIWLSESFITQIEITLRQLIEFLEVLGCFVSSEANSPEWRSDGYTRICARN